MYNRAGGRCYGGEDYENYPYQQEILDKLLAEREVRGSFRNLIVAATGTGKTVIAAFDYRRFCKQNPGKVNRLLFIAHREEILKQSQATFAGVLKDVNFGELYVGNYRPESLDYQRRIRSIITSQREQQAFPEGGSDLSPAAISAGHESGRPQIVKLRFSGMEQADSTLVSFSVNGMNFSVPEDIPSSFLAKLLGAASHGTR